VVCAFSIVLVQLLSLDFLASHCAAAAALFLGIENLMGFVAIFGADPLPTLC
jgi:hypothetical protein